MPENIRSVRAKIKQIIEEISSSNPPADVQISRNRIADSLEKVAKQDYENLSRGSQTPEGHRWNETQRSRDRGGFILVDSGRMFRSLYAEWNQGVLSVKFDLQEAPYAKFAAESRPLFADGKIPARWTETVREKLIQEIMLLIRTRFRTKG